MFRSSKRGVTRDFIINDSWSKNFKAGENLQYCIVVDSKEGRETMTDKGKIGERKSKLDHTSVCGS